MKTRMSLRLFFPLIFERLFTPKNDFHLKKCIEIILHILHALFSLHFFAWQKANSFCLDFVFFTTGTTDVDTKVQQPCLLRIQEDDNIYFSSGLPYVPTKQHANFFSVELRYNYTFQHQFHWANIHRVLENVEQW